MKVIIFENSRGGVSVMTPTKEALTGMDVDDALRALSIEAKDGEDKRELALKHVSPEVLDGYKVEQLAERDAPKGFVIVDSSAVPSSRLFREAWVMGNHAEPVIIDLNKAKVLAHKMRRNKRNIEFSHFDTLATVPHLAVEAEREREVIRKRDSLTQDAINRSKSVAELTRVVTLEKINKSID